MHACSVTATTGTADCTAIIAGYCSHEVPSAVAAAAARLAGGIASGPLAVLVDDHWWLVINLPDDDWLVGGQDWRQAGAVILAEIRRLGCTKARILVDGHDADVASVVEGAILGDYRFTACRTGKAAARKPVKLRIPGWKEAVQAGVAAATSQNIARDLADRPGNLCNPQTFVARARELFADLPVTITAIEGIKALQKANFPGLVQVGQGSVNPPALLELHYAPRGASGSVHLGLVGKGVTFDTGGISLKPAADQWKMKADMGGAAAMLGAMHLIATRKPKLKVTAIIGLAENMPDGQAQRPGDIYAARNGTFIHVDNTDAEGRLVLADCLTYICEQQPTHVVDAATLTGACMVALGENIAGVMSNPPDFADQVRAAGQTVGEEFWPLPLYAGYRKKLDHVHADINNSGGRYAGALTAGLFLQSFVDPAVSWAHCDIAGPGIMGGGDAVIGKDHMPGFGVRTVAALAQRLATV
jgi:leucyl aminopeptidase